MPSSRRPVIRVAAAVLAVAAVAACGDKNIRQLTVGITRDSVMKVLALGATSTDSTPNVYREERYLHDGRWITVLMYTNTGKEEGRDSVPDADLIPVVLLDDTLTGWGWEYRDSVAVANNIPVKSRP